jgi:hypothetical protein
VTEIVVDLEEHARQNMYDGLSDMFSEEEVDETLEEQVLLHLTKMYDNREELQAMEEEDGNI